MHIRKILVALLAVAVAYAFAPTQGVQASSLLGPGSQIGTDSLTHLTQDKGKAKAKAKGKAKAKAKRKGKRSASKGPGRCGTGNYWDKKKRACASKM
jgi:hypothetical protein